MDTVNLPTVTTHYLTSQHLAVLLLFEIKVNFKTGVPRFKITSNIFKQNKQEYISLKVVNFYGQGSLFHNVYFFYSKLKNSKTKKGKRHYNNLLDLL